MGTAQVIPERPLRIALLWNGALQDERLLTVPCDVVVGEGKDAMFPLPENVIAQESLRILEPVRGGYRFHPSPQMGGYVWIQGRRIAARTIGQPVDLGPGDYGVITFGSVSFFFQQVRRVRGLPPNKSFRDSALLACVGLSIFAHVASLLFLFLVAAQEFAPTASLELDTELMRKFMVVPPPEPEDPAQKHGGTELDDPGLRDREEMGGKRAEKEEGRVGKRDAAQEKTEIAGDPKDAVAAKVRGLGLLGVLSGGSSSAVKNALDTPSLDSLLGGLGAVQTVVGRGSGGMALRGGGKGGGGNDGPGALFGTGKLGTGVAGGKGLGKGKGGIGARGRQAREVSLSLGGKQAKVNGFLSAEQINRVVRANQAAVKYCYENALQRQAGLKGSIHIHWRIALSGKVTTARVAKSTVRNAKVEGCIVRQVKRWRFPKPDGGEVAVTYPFFFGTK